MNDDDDKIVKKNYARRLL